MCCGFRSDAFAMLYMCTFVSDSMHNLNIVAENLKFKKKKNLRCSWHIWLIRFLVFWCIKNQFRCMLDVLIGVVYFPWRFFFFAAIAFARFFWYYHSIGWVKKSIWKSYQHERYWNTKRARRQALCVERSIQATKPTSPPHVVFSFCSFVLAPHIFLPNN